MKIFFYIVFIVILVIGYKNITLSELNSFTRLIHKYSYDNQQSFFKLKDYILKPNENWPERREQFEIFGTNADVVMIGDSITHSGLWTEIFPELKIANRGVGSDRTDDVIRRINTILNLKPKKAFLMIGINDISQGRKVEEIFFDYVRIIRMLQEKNIQVYVQSTLECSRSSCGDKVEEVRKLNMLLKKFSKSNNLIYIDINNEMTNQNEGLRKVYTYDGIHLRGKGYLIWSNALKNYINQ